MTSEFPPVSSLPNMFFGASCYECKHMGFVTFQDLDDMGFGALLAVGGVRLQTDRTGAQVAELVDAQVSGTCALRGVEVRVFSWAPFNGIISSVTPCSQTPLHVVLRGAVGHAVGHFPIFYVRQTGDLLLW